MARENTVQNMSAAEAWVPIYAHVQYWGGKTLRAAMWGGDHRASKRG